MKSKMRMMVQEKCKVQMKKTKPTQMVSKELLGREAAKLGREIAPSERVENHTSELRCSELTRFIYEY